MERRGSHADAVFDEETSVGQALVVAKIGDCDDSGAGLPNISNRHVIRSQHFKSPMDHWLGRRTDSVHDDSRRCPGMVIKEGGSSE